MSDVQLSSRPPAASGPRPHLGREPLMAGAGRTLIRWFAGGTVAGAVAGGAYGGLVGSVWGAFGEPPAILLAMPFGVLVGVVFGTPLGTAAAVLTAPFLPLIRPWRSVRRRFALAAAVSGSGALPLVWPLRTSDLDPSWESLAVLVTCAVPVVLAGAAAYLTVPWVAQPRMPRGRHV